MRRLALLCAVLALPAPVSGLATGSRYAGTRDVHCVKPFDGAAGCVDSAWTTPSGGFGGQTILVSPEQGSRPGWARTEGEVAVTTSIPFRPSTPILDYTIRLQLAKVFAHGGLAGDDDKRAHVYQWLTFEHECRCVAPASADFMGPLVTTQQMEGARTEIRDRAWHAIVGPGLERWPAGTVRVTLHFGLIAYLGEYYAWPAVGVVDSMSRPGFGRVGSIVKGYVTSIRFVRDEPR